VGNNCLGSKGGCAYGTDCIVETNVREERTTFSCVARCNFRDAKPDCPADSVCVPGKASGHCRRRCAPGKGTGCGAGEQCKRLAGTADAGFCSAA
jgi:hypothetical protein